MTIPLIYYTDVFVTVMFSGYSDLTFDLIVFKMWYCKISVTDQNEYN
jgi:hypothetical protein